MNLLLDTHVLLWWLDDNPTLSREASHAIANGGNMVFVSAAVIWEIRIKQALGKLEIPQDFKEVLNKQSFEMLPITSDHAHLIKDLPTYHRDPFDRMLIVQSQFEGLTILTRDRIFKKYKIPVIRA